jgi:hypothetical protein
MGVLIYKYKIGWNLKILLHPAGRIYHRIQYHCPSCEKTFLIPPH